MKYTGRRSMRGITGMLLVLGMVWGLAGCQGGMLGGGSGMIPRDKLTPLGTVRDAHWDTRDLTVVYTLEQNANGVRISGSVRYADALRYNFSLMRYFYLGLYLTDADGRVLREEPLATSAPDSIDNFGGNRSDFDFSRSFTLPEGAAYFAFKYSAQASDPDSGDGGSNPTYFWYYPVE